MMSSHGCGNDLWEGQTRSLQIVPSATPEQVIQQYKVAANIKTRRHVSVYGVVYNVDDWNRWNSRTNVWTGPNLYDSVFHTRVDCSLAQFGIGESHRFYIALNPQTTFIE
jgi:hypothetical protein